GQLLASFEHLARLRLVEQLDLVQQTDRDLVLGPLDHLDLVAGADLALLENPQVAAGTAGLGEALLKSGLADLVAQLEAGNARKADLEERRADPPLLSDLRAGEVEPLHGQVFAEGSRRHLAVEFG